MNELNKNVLRFSVIGQDNDSTWKCISTDGSLTAHLSESLFPNKPIPSKEYVMTYDGIDYIIEEPLS